MRSTDFTAVRATLQREPAFDVAFDSIVDLRDADLRELSSDDLRSVAGQSVLRPTARRAIIADRDDRFGLARMYETFRELAGGEETTCITRSLDDAIAWLGLEGFDPMHGAE